MPSAAGLTPEQKAAIEPNPNLLLRYEATRIRVAEQEQWPHLRRRLLQAQLLDRHMP